MLKAGQETFFLNTATKDGCAAITVEIIDQRDGEFELHFSNGDADPLGRAAVRFIEGRKVWVKHIEVEPALRRRGYGTAFVQWIARACGAPIVPVQENGDGPDFWAALRSRPQSSPAVEEGISRTTYILLLRDLGLL